MVRGGQDKELFSLTKGEESVRIVLGQSCEAVDPAVPVFRGCLSGFAINLWGQSSPGAACRRPEIGGFVPEPGDMKSHEGALNVQLAYRNDIDAHGGVRYFYVDERGREAPVLRVKPGDWVVLELRNELTAISPAQPVPGGTAPVHVHGMTGACGGGTMNALATNLHFHGLAVSQRETAHGFS